MNIQPVYLALWPKIQRAIRARERALDVDMTEWHTYRLEWGTSTSSFAVDGQIVIEGVPSPRGPLGFVMWLDNQYLVATPQGRFRWGRLDAPGRQWMETADVRIENLGGPLARNT
jgi:hypothetical protein